MAKKGIAGKFARKAVTQLMDKSVVASSVA